MFSAVCKNSIEILDYLKNEQKFTFDGTLYKNNRNYFKDGNVDKKIQNKTLVWLWNNGYQWTLEEANTCNNSFMKSFFD